MKEHDTSPSAVFSHLSSCETCKSNVSSNSLSIINSGKNEYEITVKEALHISGFRFIQPRSTIFQDDYRLCNKVIEI